MTNISVYLKSSIALALVCLLSGCFEVEQTLHLGTDGKLKFECAYTIPEAYLPAFARFHSSLARWQETADGNPWLLDSEAVRQQFPDPLFTLTRHNSFSKGGNRKVEIAGTAKQGDQALASGALGNFSIGKTTAGSVRLALPIPPPDPLKTLPDAEKNALREAMKGFKLTLIIETPQPVKTTNGQKTGKNEVTWTFTPETLVDIDTLPRELFVTF